VIFGDRLSDPVLNKINEALKVSPAGLTPTEFMQTVFHDRSADKPTPALLRAVGGAGLFVVD